jgi:hypothetical protein
MSTSDARHLARRNWLGRISCLKPERVSVPTANKHGRLELLGEDGFQFLLSRCTPADYVNLSGHLLKPRFGAPQTNTTFRSTSVGWSSSSWLVYAVIRDWNQE